MNMNTGLRISRAQTLVLRNASPAFYYKTLRPVRQQRQLINTSAQPRPHNKPRAPLNAIVRKPAATATAAEAKQTPPPEPQTTRGPPAVSQPYDPKSPSAPPPRPQEPIPLSATLNPPASTRPPPLHLPAREPGASRFSYLFQLGKAYMHFYKDGLRAVFTNLRLLRSVAPPPGVGGRSGAAETRASILLRARALHDLARLPNFGVLLVVCGELTPLVVIAFPRLTPLTCRIPKQVEALRRAAAARRAESFRALEQQRRAARELGRGVGERLVAGHVARALGLTSSWWDKAGLDGPLARAKAARAVAFLARDDAMIRAAGGVAGVEDEEVVLACEDRGMDVRGKEVGELRRRLEAWVRESEGEDELDSRERVRRLLLRPELSL